MTDQAQSDMQITIEPDGRILFPERLMAEVVMHTPGGKLWFNDKDRALGIRLMRNEDNPPYRIERLPGRDGGATGLLDASDFLRKVGFEPRADRRTYSCRFHQKYLMLEVQLEESRVEPVFNTTGLLDDYPGLED